MRNQKPGHNRVNNSDRSEKFLPPDLLQKNATKAGGFLLIVLQY